MFAKIAALLALLKQYVQLAPGATTLVLSEAVVFLARVGVHVSEAQLTALIAVLVPIIIGVNVAARRSDFVEVAPEASEEK